MRHLFPAPSGGRGFLKALVAVVAAASYLGVSGGEWFHVRQCRHHEMPADQPHPTVAPTHAGHGDAGHETHGPCICVGACHSTAVSTPSERVRAAAPALPATAFRSLSIPGDRVRATDPSPYLLPFPNPPPTAI